MENTLIKFSTLTAHKHKIAICKAIHDKTNLNFDIKEYKVFYEGIFEDGLEITFFDTISKKDLECIHNILINQFIDYNCYYIENMHFVGCIKEYLFNNGCNIVKSIYKKSSAKV